MNKHWNIKQQPDIQKVRQLAQSLMPDKNIGEMYANNKDINKRYKRCYEIVAGLLIQRGIDSFDKARDFFRPNFDKLHDPFLMEDMKKAVERIEVAINANENILIYGDYDVDGTTAVALVYSYLKTFYNNIDYYIPDRYKEGYGVSLQGVDYAYEHKVKLIICLDCGIKATEEIRKASTKGIEFIVCDHHLPGTEIPEACAILDPKLPNSKYPYKELSGCGVGFKLVQALQIQRGKPNTYAELNKYLDLLAMSIAADVVPITGENRILSFLGLHVINKRPRVGLEALLSCAEIMHVNNGSFYFNRELTIADLSFLIGPRINAAGRMKSGEDAVRLLVSNDRDEALKIAKDIDAYNTDRKNKDQEATCEAKQYIERMNLKNNKCIVICNESWHQGIIGIVASRIAEEEVKPTIIFTKTDGIMTGSARSVKNFDIYSAIESCRHLLTHFGGHKFAAGLSLKEENFAEFQRLFEEQVDKHITSEDVTPEIDIDMPISLGDISERMLRILQQFQPFGPENNIPVFCSYEVCDAASVRKVGKNHLKFSAIATIERSEAIPCIGFSLGEYFDLLHKGDKVDICYTIEENNFFKKPKPDIQLNVKDIRKSSEE